jgi:anion-transporting  ArsA/GET3 family ATPase
LSEPPRPDLDGLFGKKLVIVSGKGGVGKTTVAATLGALAARGGRTVLLLSSDGRGDAAPLFGREDAGYRETELAPGLYALTADFDALLDDFVRTVAPVKLVASRILSSSTFRYFTRATPGLPDLLLLGKTRELFKRKSSTRREPRYDLAVIDAPAAGHALSLVGIPRAILRTVPAGPMRTLAKDLDAVLSDPTASALVVVAEPAELAAREAEELVEGAKERSGLETALVVVNRLGRSGREEVLPRIGLPTVLVPEIDTAALDEIETAPTTGAQQFFEQFLFTFEENAAAPRSGAHPKRTPSRPAREAKGSSSGRPLFAAHHLDTSSWLDSAHLLVLTGPGGVGKTTLSAAAGIAAARRGRRVLVLTVDPARRLAQALGLSAREGRSDRPVPVAVAGLPKGAALFAMQIDPKASFERLLSRVASPDTVSRVQANRLYTGLVDSLPGVLEYMGVEALAEHAKDPEVDLIVLDTPPAARGLDFLSAPDRMVQLLSNDALRWFLRSDSLLGRALSGASRGAAAVLRLADRALGFGFLADLAEFFGAFDGLYEGFQARSREISALLSKGHFLVVSSVDASALRTAAETAAGLKKRGAAPGLVLNRVPVSRGALPPLPSGLSGLDGLVLFESAAPAADLPAALADGLLAGA